MPVIQLKHTFALTPEGPGQRCLWRSMQPCLITQRGKQQVSGPGVRQRGETAGSWHRSTSAVEPEVATQSPLPLLTALHAGGPACGEARERTMRPGDLGGERGGVPAGLLPCT